MLGEESERTFGPIKVLLVLFPFRIVQVPGELNLPTVSLKSTHNKRSSQAAIGKQLDKRGEREGDGESQIWWY